MNATMFLVLFLIACFGFMVYGIVLVIDDIICFIKKKRWEKKLKTDDYLRFLYTENIRLWNEVCELINPNTQLEEFTIALKKYYENYDNFTEYKKKIRVEQLTE